VAFDSGGNPSGQLLVVDNSVTMRWLFDDGSDADRRYAARVLRSIRSQDLAVLVPGIWLYEAAFVVGYYTGQGKLSETKARSHLDFLFDLVSVIPEREPPRALFEYSRASGVSAYDSAYLMIARSHDAAIATLDKKMRRVARKFEIAIA
jgi:predicted nucleic acid-binding protein